MNRSVTSVLILCVLIGACNSKKIKPFSVEENVFKASDGFRVQVDNSFTFVGVGTDVFPVNFFGYRHMDKGDSHVFVTTSDGHTVKEIAAISYLVEEHNKYFGFSEPKGEKREFGIFKYNVSTGSGTGKEPFLKTHFRTSLDAGYSISRWDHFYLKYSKTFRNRIRCLTYIIDYKELPEGIKDSHDDIVQYLHTRMNEIFILED